MWLVGSSPLFFLVSREIAALWKRTNRSVLKLVFFPLQNGTRIHSKDPTKSGFCAFWEFCDVYRRNWYRPYVGGVEGWCQQNVNRSVRLTTHTTPSSHFQEFQCFRIAKRHKERKQRQTNTGTLDRGQQTPAPHRNVATTRKGTRGGGGGGGGGGDIDHCSTWGWQQLFFRSPIGLLMPWFVAERESKEMKRSFWEGHYAKLKTD